MLSFVMNNGIFFIKTYIYICDLYTFTCESGGVFFYWLKILRLGTEDVSIYTVEYIIRLEYCI